MKHIKAWRGTFAYPMASGSRIAPILRIGNAASPRHTISYQSGCPDTNTIHQTRTSRCLIFQDGFKFARFEALKITFVNALFPKITRSPLWDNLSRDKISIYLILFKGKVSVFSFLSRFSLICFFLEVYGENLFALSDH